MRAYEPAENEQPGSGDKSDITWNFEKFLVDPDGKVVKRFAPQVTPEEIRPRHREAARRVVTGRP